MNDIYHDIVLQICRWMDVKAFSRLTSTSKHLASFFNYDPIWEVLVKNSIKNPPRTMKYITWKRYFKDNSTIKFVVKTTDLHGNPIELPIAIDMKGKLISYHQDNVSTYNGNRQILDEIFKRIPGSFILNQKCKTLDGYFYRDAQLKEIPKKIKSHFDWSDPKVQDLSISVLTPASVDKKAEQDAWKHKFEFLRDRPGTKKFTFKLE